MAGILDFDFLKKKPIREFLKKRPTLILEKPLVEMLGIDPPELPPGITREEAIEVVAATEWARNLATGWLKAFMPTLTPGTPEYEEAHKRISRRVAAGVI